jgi:ubiquinone/menaquinone biosynthesis C-methylase UbiE
LRTLTKDWDQHVVDAEELSRRPGFQALRDQIIAWAKPRSHEEALDVGAGTGLLTLALAEQVKSVWAIDISPAMCEYLRAKATSACCDNVETAMASAVSLPLVDESLDLVVSNYCFHHLQDADKRRALAEAWRVLRPGGRLVFADMMFRPSLGDSRDRRVISSKLRAMLRKGPAGLLRLARNGVRLAATRWEKPARPDWWRRTLEEAGFVDVRVQPLCHEGGVARGSKPG